jgi:hypothetical protein
MRALAREKQHADGQRTPCDQDPEQTSIQRERRLRNEIDPQSEYRQRKDHENHHKPALGIRARIF